METSGIQPVMNVGGYGGYGDGFGWGGGNFAWFIILFALLGGGGWNNQRGMATQADVYAANDMQDMKANQRQIMSIGNNLGNGIADATFSLSRDINQGNCMLDKSIMQGNFAVEKAVTDSRYVIGEAVNNNRFATQQGFADTGRNIDSVKYENAMNTCKITETDTFNTQKILDKLNSMELNAMKSEADNLRMQLADARLAVSQCAQNQYLVNTIAPCPRPAYVVPNPYCNCGNCGVN